MANVKNLLAVREAIVAESVAKFDMTDWAPPCGTYGCIGGFCNIMTGHNGRGVSADKKIDAARDFLGLSEFLACNLFFMGPTRHSDGYSGNHITRADAIAAIDNVILHGEPRWVEVIATRPHSVDKPAPVRALPASITDALTAREGPLRGEEPSDAELTAAMEVQS